MGRILEIFHRHVPDKVVASSKLGPQYYGVAVILKCNISTLGYTFFT